MPTTSTTTDVIDAHGATKNLNDRLAPGRVAAANAYPVVFSIDDLAAINALGTTLSSILTKLGTARTETLWTDDTGAYFVRVDNAGTISWTDTSGTTSSAPGTGSRPAAGTTVLLDKSTYQATAAATGYSIGDLLDHLVTTDPSTGAVIGHFWLNTTTEAKLASAPSSANITPLSPLPTGAATAANQSTIATTLAALLAIEQDTTTPMPVQAQQPTVLVTLTPTLDTSGAYSANDVLFGTTALSLARANNLCVGLESINAVDKTKQNPALTLFFFSSNVTSAAANAAEALSDADALSYLGHVSFAAGDWKTMANNSRACKTSINLILKPGTGSTNVWVVGILDAGSPTFALGDLQFGIGVVQS